MRNYKKDTIDLNKCINFVLNNINTDEPYGKLNPLYMFLEFTFPDYIKKLDARNIYNPKGSLGPTQRGTFQNILSVSILDKDISEDSPKKGIYMVYLFNRINEAYLSLSWGSGQFENENIVPAVLDIRNFLIRHNLFQQLEERGFSIEIDLEGHDFEDGSIISKCYLKDEVPSHEELLEDLKLLEKAYLKIKRYYDGEYRRYIDNDECEEYGDNQFLVDVYIEDTEYETLKEILLHKKNLIIQGPPGVGKTYLAKRLAYSILEKKDDRFVEMVQFHQSYSYEDFIMGYRPTEDGGFELKEGVFYEFCKAAQVDSNTNHKYFFIIDEINRRNLSKIFGELFMLIENDKRGEEYKIKLLYSDEEFFIPKNLYIIGLMNTADRSIAMVDYALRRRFDFYDLEPAFDNEKFKQDLSRLAVDLTNLTEYLNTTLNNESISGDQTLGSGFCIGHSYFCDFTDEGGEALNEEGIKKRVNAIIEYEILPLLKEYWFDDKSKYDTHEEELKDYIYDFSTESDPNGDDEN